MQGYEPFCTIEEGNLGHTVEVDCFLRESIKQNNACNLKVNAEIISKEDFMDMDRDGKQPERYC